MEAQQEQRMLSVFDPDRDTFAGRGLTEWMLRQFEQEEGLLHPVLQAVLADPTLELEIRRHYVNIYYRGGNLMEIRQPRPDLKRLTATFDKKYIQKYADEPWRVPATTDELAVHEWLDTSDLLGTRTLDSPQTVQKHVASFSYRQLAMDANKMRRPKQERETQQKVAAANNSQDSEYLVCDVEYSVSHGHPGGESEKDKTSFLDMVAVYRPDPTHGASPELVLIELKYGANAIDGTAGLRDHVADLKQLMAIPGSLDAVREEVARMMLQKYRLGLTPVRIESLAARSPVDYVVAVSGHNPRSQVLRDALLGRHGLDEPRLECPTGLRVRIAILDEDCVLRTRDLHSLDDLCENDVPEAIFCGTLRDRRLRKDELPAV